MNAIIFYFNLNKNIFLNKKIKTILINIRVLNIYLKYSCFLKKIWINKIIIKFIFMYNIFILINEKHPFSNRILNINISNLLNIKIFYLIRYKWNSFYFEKNIKFLNICKLNKIIPEESILKIKIGFKYFNFLIKYKLIKSILYYNYGLIKFRNNFNKYYDYIIIRNISKIKLKKKTLKLYFNLS